SGRQHLSRIRDHDGRIAAAGGHQGGGETETDLRIRGLLLRLGPKGGDFRWRNGSRPWPATTGHRQTAHDEEQAPAASQRRGLPPREGELRCPCLLPPQGREANE